MAQKTNPKARAQARSSTYKPGQTGDKARASIKSAVDAGQKASQAASDWWTKIWAQQRQWAEWQRQALKLGELTMNALPLAGKGMDEIGSLMARSGRANAELMTKAVQAARTAGFGLTQGEWFDMWAASMKTMQCNLEAFTDIGAKALDSWLVWLRKNSEVVEIHVPKASAV